MNAADVEDFLMAFRDIAGGGALDHGTSVAGIIAAQRITTTVVVDGSEKQVETAPGIAPGTKIIPFQVLGALSMNWCTGTNCARSRPHLKEETKSTFKRMNAVITLAKRDGAFAINASLGNPPCWFQSI